MKERIADSIERKIGLKDAGLIGAFSLYNTIRRMQIIYRLFSDTNDFDKHFHKI
jgi:hypothetical protein